MRTYSVFRIPYTVISFVACGLLSVAYPAYSSESYGMVAAERPFLEGNYDKAVSESDRLICSGAEHKDELYYLKGLSLLKLNRFTDARRTFEELLTKYPNSSRAFDARVGIGDSFFLDRNSGAASSIYNDIIQKFPGNANIESVRKRLADCGQSQGPALARQEATYNASAKTESAGSIERFSVQVGSFKSKRNADGLTKKLSSRGYTSYVEVCDAAGTKMYRVKIGRQLSRDDAEKLAAKMKVSGYPTRICQEN